MAKRKTVSEAQWFAYRDPELLFFALAKTRSRARYDDELRANAGARKLRLFAAACCRLVWSLLDDSRRWLQGAVETCEREADQLANNLQLTLARETANELWEEWRETLAENDPHIDAALAVLTASARNPAMAVDAYEQSAMGRLKANGLASLTESRETMIAHGAYDLEVAILRDIFNPFAAPPFAGIGKGGSLTVAQQLALAMYEERSFVDMPLLADALRDAGCTDEKLLQHCREGQNHVRGCWAIDFILDWK